MFVSYIWRGISAKITSVCRVHIGGHVGCGTIGNKTTNDTNEISPVVAVVDNDIVLAGDVLFDVALPHRLNLARDHKRHKQPKTRQQEKPTQQIQARYASHSHLLLRKHTDEVHVARNNITHEISRYCERAI